MARSIMDMVRVQVKPKSKKIKNAPGSRLRFAMKYKGTLKATVDRTLLGRSQIMEDIASAKGWYMA